MQTRTLVACVLSATACATANALAAAPALMRVQIDSQPLGKALNAWVVQTGYQMLMPAEDSLSAEVTPAVSGLYTPEGALRVLLARTDLKFDLVNARTVAIRASRTSQPDEDIRLAQAQGTSGARAPDPGARRESSGMTEVVVTAQKRSERLEDVPIPVTAVGAEALVNSNQLRLQDYASSIPGLSLSPANARGAPVLAIRGIATGETNPTVGVTVDDVPFGSSSSSAGGFFVPDIDPSDLARIEVLRGPQGTLYGASSMGGMLKFVTVDPSTEAISGFVQGGVSSVSEGSKLGYNARAAGNLPLGDTLAMRVSGFTRRDPGYIDNVQTGERNVNATRTAGGRLSALWTPSDTVSLKLGALYQDRKMDGSPYVYVQPGLGDLQQNALIGSRGPATIFQVYSAELKARFGEAELTSVSGYSTNKYSDVLDSTPSLGTQTFTRYGVRGAANHEDWKTRRFTQEVRVAAPLGRKLDWLLGGYYSNDKSHLVTNLTAVDPVTGAIPGPLLYQDGLIRFEEYAAFGNLTIHFTDQFDMQFGARESHNQQDRTTPVLTGPLASTPTIGKSDDNAFTYLVTPRLHLSPDLMVYARLASSYRPGGFNSYSIAGAPAGLPTSYSPDKTLSYELGAKGAVLDGVLSYDASIYYIDWKDIQILQTLPNGTGYTGNPGRAKSKGVEVSLEANPFRGMKISTWAAWNRAELSEAFPLPPLSSVFGLEGDRLPYSSRFSGNLSVDQEFPLSVATGFVGASVSYVGDRKGVFTRTADRQTLPAYARTDVRAGLKYEMWTINLFLNNVTDRRGVLTGGLGTTNPAAFFYIQPRTAGLSFMKSF